MRTRVLGMGNPILTDDSVGVRLARDLARRLGTGRDDVEIVEECSVGGLGLLDEIRDCERLIVLDSIRTAGGTPGNWYRVDAGSLRQTLHLDGPHDANFATVLALARRLGMRVPADGEIHIFAVEVEDPSSFGERMTPALEAAYPELSREILAEVESLLG